MWAWLYPLPFSTWKGVHSGTWHASSRPLGKAVWCHLVAHSLHLFPFSLVTPCRSSLLLDSSLSFSSLFLTLPSSMLSFPWKWVLEAPLSPTPCNPMDCSPPVSSLHGILRARILESPGPPCLPWCPGLYPTHPGWHWPISAEWEQPLQWFCVYKRHWAPSSFPLGLTEEVTQALWSLTITAAIEAQRESFCWWVGSEADC